MLNDTVVLILFSSWYHKKSWVQWPRHVQQTQFLGIHPHPLVFRTFRKNLSLVILCACLCVGLSRFGCHRFMCFRTGPWRVALLGGVACCWSRCCLVERSMSLCRQALSSPMLKLHTVWNQNLLLAACGKRSPSAASRSRQNSWFLQHHLCLEIAMLPLRVMNWTSETVNQPQLNVLLCKSFLAHVRVVPWQQ